MASITLTAPTIALTRAIDQPVTFTGAAVERRQSHRARGAVRHYAGGVRRAVSVPGEDAAVTVTFRWATRAEVARLEAWIGSTVLYRDQFSHADWGLLTSVRAVRQPSAADGYVTCQVDLAVTTQTPESLL